MQLDGKTQASQHRQPQLQLSQWEGEQQQPVNASGRIAAEDDQSRGLQVREHSDICQGAAASRAEVLREVQQSTGSGSEFVPARVTIPAAFWSVPRAATTSLPSNGGSSSTNCSCSAVGVDTDKIISTPAAAAARTAAALAEARAGGMALRQPKAEVSSTTGSAPTAAGNAMSAGRGTAAAGGGGKIRRPKRVECVVCMDARAEVMLLPCKHTILCQACAELVRTAGKPLCPMCRTAVEGQVLVGEGEAKGGMMLATTAAAAAALGHSDNPAPLVRAPAAADVASSSSSALSDAVIRPEHTIVLRTLPLTAADWDPAVLPSAGAMGSAAAATGVQSLASLPQSSALSSSSSSSLPSVLQPLLTRDPYASSGTPSLLAMHGPPPPSVLSASSTWTPPMLQHLFPHGSRLHQSSASSSGVQPSLAVSSAGAAASGVENIPSSSRVQRGPSPAVASVVTAAAGAAAGAAAAGQSSGGAVMSFSGVQQDVSGHFMHEVCGLLSETEAHANALLSQSQAQIDEFQLQVDAARAQLDHQRAQWAEFLEQLRSRMQQLCQNYV